MNNSSPLHRRERLKLSVRFRLRAGQNTGEQPRQLYIRLTVNGVTASDYASGVKVRPDKWNSSLQKVTGTSKLAQELNRELEQIEAEHRNLLAELMRLHQAGIIPQLPTASLLRQHWTQKATLIPTLLEAFDTYLAYLESLEGTPDGREVRTLSKWKNGRSYLSDYVEASKSEKLTVDLVTEVWAKGFYHYLIKKPLGLASAARFVGYLRASINHMVEIRKVGYNPIINYYPDKGKDKPIYFLEEEHLDRLWALEAGDHSHGLVRDWLLLMCYTGLDQPDLERYVVNPAQYTQVTEDGPMIVINRGKTELTACIPLLGEVHEVLARHPNGIKPATNQLMNSWTWIIEKQIGFEHRFTTKICRKTAGALFLRNGFRMEEVSKILGHSNMQTTMRNYVKVTAAMVQAGMRRVQQSAEERIKSPFLSIENMEKAS